MRGPPRDWRAYLTESEARAVAEADAAWARWEALRAGRREIQNRATARALKGITHSVKGEKVGGN